jgi:hypothetical protein
MLRINAHTTWRVREILRRWRAEHQVQAAAPIAALERLGPSAFDWLAVRLFQWLVRPNRRLSIGVTLADVAGDDFAQFEDHADLTLGGFAAGVERRGPRHALWRAAAHGGQACQHWWGTPGWPRLVARLLEALDDPDHPHWGEGAKWRGDLWPEPTQVADRGGLRRTLLQLPVDTGNRRGQLARGGRYQIPTRAPAAATGSRHRRWAARNRPSQRKDRRRWLALMTHVRSGGPVGKSGQLPRREGRR